MKTNLWLSLFVAIFTISPVTLTQQPDKAENLYQDALMQMEGRGNHSKALEIFGRIAKEFPGNRRLCALSHFQIGACYEKLGKSEAQKAYERVIKDYADQREVVAEARSRLLALENASQSKKVPELSVRQVWTGAGVDIEGGISQDGRYLSFTDWSTGDLAVRDMSTGTIRRLTNKGSWSSRESADFSTVSPDGKRVAYAWLDESGNCSLRLVGIDGSEPRILYRGTGEYLLPEAWSQDGTEILAILWGKEAGTNITLISTIDSSLRVLKSFDRGSPGKMTFSPDGRWIAYDHAQDGNAQDHDISLLASDGTRQVRLIEHPANDVSPVWAPNGKSILFTSDRGGTPGFWLVSVLDGKAQGSPRLVKPDVGNIRPFSITSNGTLYYGLSVGGDDVYTADIDPTSGKLLSAPAAISSRFVGFNSTPACSPDGQFLAYISSRGRNQSFWAPGNRVLVIRSLKTGEDRESLVNFGLGFELSWAPDSRSLMVVGKDSLPTPHLFQVDTKTRESKVLVDRVWTTSEGHAAKGWFPDGKSIYLTRGLPMRFVRHNLASGEQQQIFTWNPDEFSFRFATLSPDGMQFAAWRRNLKTDSIGIILIPAGGGEPRELFLQDDDAPQELGGTAGGLSWTADGRFVMFARRTGAGKKMDLWRVAVARGKPEKLGPLSQKVHDLVVHPDGKRIFFSTREKIWDVWAMENFLPKQDLSLQDTAPRTRQIWAGSDVDALGTPSPDGHSLSFVDWETGDLAIRDLDTGKKRRVTSKGSWEQSYEFAFTSIFSPDGRQLAYSWFNKENAFDLHLIASDGLGHRLLCHDEKIFYVGPLDWSADGRQILAVSSDYDYNSQLVVVSVEDGSSRTLKQMGWRAPWKAYFSRDGKHIAYDFPTRENSPERDIYLMRTDGSQEIPLVKHPADDYLIGWAADGERILFASDRTGTWDIWAVQVGGRERQDAPELVKREAGSMWPLGITKSGGLYYSVNTGSEDVYIAGVDFMKGTLLSRPEKLISRFSGANFSPTFSPDGNSIAYVSERGPRAGGRGHRVLCIRSLKTGEEREVSLKLAAFSKLSWSPNGRYILLTALGPKDRQGMYRVDVQTNEVSLVMEKNASDENVKGRVWSNDSRAVYYTVTELKKKLCRLMMREVETGKEHELYRQGAPPDFSRLSLSPDGTQLAFSTRDPKTKSSCLRIISAQGGESRVLLTAEPQATIVPIAWAPNGTEILYAKLSGSRSEQTSELYRIEAKGGEPQKLPFPLPLERMSDFCIHPDGQRVAFTSGKQTTEIWAMENFLGTVKYP